MCLQVESELEMAMGEIESLTRKIEFETSPGRLWKNGVPVNRRKFAGQTPSVGVKQPLERHCGSDARKT
ncbi:hypothetical protein BDR03DRAFT_226398 [Suillus americanus]|nr:hypothetical protein BDR03DRAFT_226398 [Suillus americanus]